MPTDVTKTIGSAGGRDYSTLALWIAGCPANLVTADQRWIGNAYNDSEFTASGGVLSISGITDDATRYVILQAATGQSFSDNANVRTNALSYDATKGVAIRSTSGAYSSTVTISATHTQLSGLQIKNPSAKGTPLDCLFTSNTALFSNLILDRTGDSGDYIRIAGTLKNSLIVDRGASGNGCYIQAIGGKILGCTIVSLNGSSGSGVGISYGSGTIKDCAVFGFATFSGSSSVGGSNNATDLSSVGFGTNNQTSLTFASQFISTTVDFRAASGGGLHNGTPDSTNIPTDISGTTRDATTPWIGCWEVVTVAASSPAAQTDWPNPSRRQFPGLHSGFFKQTELNLIGQDAFFGVAGNPNEDWPVPKGPTGSVSLRTWSDNPRATLAGQDRFYGDPGEAPENCDWLVPAGRAYAATLRTWTDSVKLNLAGLDQFFAAPGQSPGQHDWPVPAGRTPVVALKTHAQPTPLNLLGQDTFYASAGQVPTYEFPVPSGRKSAISLRHADNNLLENTLFVVVMPSGQWDWPVPKARSGSVSLLTFTDQFKLELVGQDKFYGVAGNPLTDWPVPRTRKPPPLSFTLMVSPGLNVVPDINLGGAGPVIQGFFIPRIAMGYFPEGEP